MKSFQKLIVKPFQRKEKPIPVKKKKIKRMSKRKRGKKAKRSKKGKSRSVRKWIHF